MTDTGEELRAGAGIRRGQEARQNEAVAVCLTSTRSGRCSLSSPCCGSSPPWHTGVMTADMRARTAPSARISGSKGSRAIEHGDDQPADPALFYRDKDQLNCCRTAASQSLKFIPLWNMTANACARQPRRPNTTRREHTIPQQDKATHVSNHREHRRRISAPAGHRNPATAVETRTPVVRVCPRRLVAPINRTDQRTSLTAGSTLVAGRLNRQRSLPRK